MNTDRNTTASLRAALEAENARRKAAKEPLIPAGPTVAEINLNGATAVVIVKA